MKSSAAMLWRESRGRPHILLDTMVEATIEVCKIMQGTTLNPRSEPFPPDALCIQNVEYGSSISLGGSETGWNVGLFADEMSCKQLAARMIRVALSTIQPEQFLDALGETLNVVAGVGRRKLPAEISKRMVLGLPSFITGDACFNYLSNGIWTCCQSENEQDGAIKVIVVVREGEKP
jgi:hypothetical protein